MCGLLTPAGSSLLSFRISGRRMVGSRGWLSPGSQAYRSPKRRSTWSSIVPALLLWCLAADTSGAVQEWVVGEGGVSWEAVMNQDRSRNVETTEQGWLQQVRVDPDRNLCLGVFDRGGWYTGAGGNLIWSGSIHGAFDGDPNTAAIIIRGRGRISVDLGASYPVNRLRFYPRSRFHLRFIPGFEVFVNDGHLAPDLSGRDMWTLASVTAEGSTNNVINWRRLYERRDNLESEVDLAFDRQYVRYLQISDFVQSTWEMAQIEIYGDGYVREADYGSNVIDLGETADFGNLSWDLQLDPGAQVTVRTRSGRTPDPYRYYRLTGIGPSGQTRVSREEYVRLRDDRGSMELDTDNWSFWSPPYNIEAGSQAMQSPGPRRYVQFQIHFQAGETYDDGVRFQRLELEYYAPPLADEITGEIAPAVVEPGMVTTFRYALAGRFAPGHRGFNTVHIMTPVQIDPATVREVYIGGIPVDAAVTAEADHFVLTLPRQVQHEEDVVTLTFDCPVFVPGTLFAATVYEHDGARIGQQVVSGSAAAEVGTSSLAVNWALEGTLLGNVEVSPSVITPSGDGVNDAATISFAVLQLTQPARVTVQVFDLQGRLLWDYTDRSSSGPVTIRWTGVDRNGHRVLPGTYVYSISVRAAGKEDRRTGLIAVVY